MSTAKFSPHCAYHNVMCEEQKVRVDTAWGLPHPHDDNSPEVAAIHAESQWLDLIDTAKASSRELGLSWGENIQGPLCNTDGSAACFLKSGRAAMYLQCPSCLAAGPEDPSAPVCEFTFPAPVPVPTVGWIALAVLAMLLAAAGLRRLREV